jgi:hypothetical protein
MNVAHNAHVVGFVQIFGEVGPTREVMERH